MMKKENLDTLNSVYDIEKNLQCCILYFDRINLKYQYSIVIKERKKKQEFFLKSTDFYSLRKKFCDIDYYHYLQNDILGYKKVFKRMYY